MVENLGFNTPLIV